MKGGTQERENPNLEATKNSIPVIFWSGELD